MHVVENLTRHKLLALKPTTVRQGLISISGKYQQFEIVD